MVLLVAVILALLAGFIITSLQSFDRVGAVATAAPGVTPNASSSPTALSTATSTSDSTAVPEEGIWSQVRAARLFDQIAHQVEAERGLTPRTEVPLSFMDEGQMTAALSQVYAERDPERELLPYALLHLVPAGPVSVHARASAGVYLPEQEQLYVATDRPQSDAEAQVLLVHAYVHALQDQHFDLESLALRAGTLDGELAVEALVEGDAILLTALYGAETLSSVDWDRLSTLIIQAETAGHGIAGDEDALARSETWTRLQRFPHDEGRAFVQSLFEGGGWGAVNDAYLDPPRSTEQVLHPSRYGGQRVGAGSLRDEPTRVVVPDLGPVLGGGWRMLVEETMGEFVTGLYLDETLGETRAWQAADGWDGDTLVAWEREDGGRVRVWRSVWDTSAEAAQFEQALGALIPQRYYPVRPVQAPRGLPGEWWEAEGGAMRVYRAGRHVLFVHAPDLNTAANLAEVLP
jgi:hypothetical protein